MIFRDVAHTLKTPTCMDTQEHKIDYGMIIVNSYMLDLYRIIKGICWSVQFGPYHYHIVAEVKITRVFLWATRFVGGTSSRLSHLQLVIWFNLDDLPKAIYSCPQSLRILLIPSDLEAGSIAWTAD